MILIINVCKEKLHYYEFVKPIEDILLKNKLEFFTRDYKKIKDLDLEKSSKAIICGTSLKDLEYLKNIDSFSWLKKYEKPVLGICAGMQIIGEIFGAKSKKQTEIGFFHERFDKNFLGLKEEVQVYHLHNNFTELKSGFDIYSTSKIIQAAKHQKKEIYLTLFHPEVRNKELIKNFSLL